jgi:hypothetical protein
VSSIDLALHGFPVKHSLGLSFDFGSDQCCIQTDCATKREILRETASVYDPFRFLSPVVLHAKLILQALCRISVNWDEPFEPKMVEEWRKWATSLLDLNKFFIPCYFNPEVVRSRGVGLHVFAYASVSAFGAIAYLCFNHTEGVKIAFIMRKPGSIVQICIDYLARIMHRPSSCRSQHPSRTKSAKKLIKQLSGRIRLPF